MFCSTYLLWVQLDRFTNFLLFSWWCHDTCVIEAYYWYNMCPWTYTRIFKGCLSVLIWLHLSLHWNLWLSVSCVLWLTGCYEIGRLGRASQALVPWGVSSYFMVYMINVVFCFCATKSVFSAHRWTLIIDPLSSLVGVVFHFDGFVLWTPPCVWWGCLYVSFFVFVTYVHVGLSGCYNSCLIQ